MYERSLEQLARRGRTTYKGEYLMLVEGSVPGCPPVAAAVPIVIDRVRQIVAA